MPRYHTGWEPLTSRIFNPNLDLSHMSDRLLFPGQVNTEASTAPASTCEEGTYKNVHNDTPQALQPACTNKEASDTWTDHPVGVRETDNHSDTQNGFFLMDHIHWMYKTLATLADSIKSQSKLQYDSSLISPIKSTTSLLKGRGIWRAEDRLKTYF